MQYDRYEKLIVVEMGVELTNWPGDVPFRTVSDIGAFHHLRRLRDALTLADPEERCKWVNLPEEDWNSRKAAYQKKEADTLPKKRKRKKAPAVVDSDSQSGSDPWSDDQLEGTGRRKKTKKTTGADEENLPTAPETAFQTTNVGCAAKRKGVAAVKERALAKGKGVVAAKRGTFTKGKSVVAAKGRALAKDKGKAALINQDVNKEPYASLVPAT
jgi:hypothetical protein